MNTPELPSLERLKEVAANEMDTREHASIEKLQAQMDEDIVTICARIKEFESKPSCLRIFPNGSATLALLEGMKIRVYLSRLQATGKFGDSGSADIARQLSLVVGRASEAELDQLFTFADRTPRIKNILDFLTRNKLGSLTEIRMKCGEVYGDMIVDIYLRFDD